MLFDFIRRLRRDESGLGFIELALVTPLLGLLVLGMLDGATIIQTCLDLEQAAQRTTDYALAKRPRNDDKTYLETAAYQASGAKRENISVNLIFECSGVKQTRFDGSCSPGQVAKRFVTVTIKRQVHTGFNWRLFAALGGGTGTQYVPVTVKGDSTVRLQ